MDVVNAGAAKNIGQMLWIQEKNKQINIVVDFNGKTNRDTHSQLHSTSN